MRSGLCFTILLCSSLFLGACFGGDNNGSSQPADLKENADLLDLTLSDVPLEQTFQASQLSYTASVNYLTHATTVTPTTDSGSATVNVNGTVVDSGTASDSIALNEVITTITIVVTAEDGSTTKTYVVEVTRQTADTFAWEAYIKASNAERADYFSSSISLSGDTLVVGAPGKSIYGTLVLQGAPVTEFWDNAGAVYVFTHSNGIWTQQAYLRASNAEGGNGFALIAGDAFGSSVAISGDTLTVGAPWEASSASGGEADNSAEGAGAVYVFTRSSGTWTQQALLKASNAEGEPETGGDYGDLFGSSVAISGDIIVAGAPREASSASGGEADNSAYVAGAVYVFTRSSGAWTQQAYIKASNAEGGEFFGSSVAISGDTLAVGAPNENSSASGGEADNSAEGAGAVYVFTSSTSSGAWTQQAYIKASNAEAYDFFGSSLALSGDTLAVGATGESSSVSGGEIDNSILEAGAVYVFTQTNGVWIQEAYLKASNAEAPDTSYDNGRDHFGSSVALSGDNLAVGAPGEDSSAFGGETDNTASSAGAAYVFARTGGTWVQLAFRKAPNAEGGDRFGSSIALSGDIQAVGAAWEDSSVGGGETDNSALNAGAVYIFR